MSIKSLFENIANAIKNVYGTTDTLTPAEMPQAITNFNSIFQTKNLSAPISGQTTVEGCLSSLSSDLSELESDLTKHTLNTEYNLLRLNTSESNPFVAPNDGYLMVNSGNDKGLVFIKRTGGQVYIGGGVSGYASSVTFIRKGMEIYVGSPAPAIASFYILE